MGRRLLLALGVLELLAPRRIVEPAERLAFENADEARLRRWTIPMARLEGLLFCWLVLRGGRIRQSTSVRSLLFLIGVPALLTPHRVLDGALAISYRNADEIVLKPWVTTLTRIVGLVYLLIAFGSGSGGDHEESVATTTADTPSE